jgi:hypothetical protein
MSQLRIASDLIKLMAVDADEPRDERVVLPVKTRFIGPSYAAFPCARSLLVVPAS